VPFGGGIPPGSPPPARPKPQAPLRAPPFPSKPSGKMAGPPTKLAPADLATRGLPGRSGPLPWPVRPRTTEQLVALSWEAVHVPPRRNPRSTGPGALLQCPIYGEERERSRNIGSSRLFSCPCREEAGPLALRQSRTPLPGANAAGPLVLPISPVSGGSEPLKPPVKLPWQVAGWLESTAGRQRIGQLALAKYRGRSPRAPSDLRVQIGRFAKFWCWVHGPGVDLPGILRARRRGREADQRSLDLRPQPAGPGRQSLLCHFGPPQPPSGLFRSIRKLFGLGDAELIGPQQKVRRRKAKRPARARLEGRQLADLTDIHQVGSRKHRPWNRVLK